MKKRIGTTVLLAAALTVALVTVIFAIETPGFLDSSTPDIPGGNHTYEVFYTIDCNGGEDCECDDLPDLDSDDDDVADTDSPNDCVATFDSDFDNVPDSFEDADLDGIPNVVDRDWAGGGDGSGLVESVPRVVQNTLNRYVNNWGMKDPEWDLDENRDIYVFDINYRGLANVDGENLDAAVMLTEAPEPRGTVLHELWHNTQFAYGAGGGNWLIEGQARMMQDMVFDDLDNRVTSRYHKSVNYYLDNPNYVLPEDRDDDGSPEFDQATGLLGASYDASLWWKYTADQAGTDFVGTAGEGVDFLIEVLEQADENGRLGVDGTDAALQAALGQGMEATFWDFSIANYAKDFDLSELSHSSLGGRDPEVVLTYSDEKRDAPDILIYGPTVRTVFDVGTMLGGGDSGSVAAFDSEVSDAEAMPAYGVKTYEAFVPPSSCELVYWRVLGDPGAVLMNSFMLIQPDSNGDGVEEVVVLSRSQGQNFARAGWTFDQPNAYTRMVGIVATGNNPYGYDYEVGCTLVNLNIQNPTNSNPEFVGTPTDPGRFLVWLEITGSAGTSNFVEGLQWDRDFTVEVGGDEATILNGSYVNNGYWLEVQAPDKPGASVGDAFDLTVTLGPQGMGKVDTETDAIVYDVLLTDQVLVLDNSGSMGDNGKLAAAQTAARLFSDVAQENERLGVVSFNTDANEEYGLAFIPDDDDNAGVRAGAMAAIDLMTAGGATSIGDGLQLGQNMLNVDGDPDHPWAMVLLSDGMENEPLYWIDVKANIVNAGTEVHAIALGQDADEDQMREIAQATCGSNWQEKCYHYLDESGVAFQMAGRNMAGNLDNALADLFLQIKEAVNGHQRVWQEAGEVTADGFEYTIHLPNEMRDVSLSFHFDGTVDPAELHVSGPGSFEKLTDGQSHVVFHADVLPAGDYQVWRDHFGSTTASTWIGSLSGRVIAGVEMNVFIATPESLRKPGKPLSVQVALGDGSVHFIKDAVVTAVVRHPDGDLQTVRFMDDGGIYDDVAGDGVYGYVYDRVNRPLDFDVLSGHTWVFDIEATGVDSNGREFTRYEQLAYTPDMRIDPMILDGEGDAMLDLWEARFAATNHLVADGTLDPDGDGLTNKEEFELGTNPDNPDTDFGGEMDGSEVAKGQDPLWPEDDTIPAVTDFWIENLPGAVALHFDPRPEYLSMAVYRRKGLVGPWTMVGSFDPAEGRIVDEDVVNDTDYFYYMQPRGASGSNGRPTMIRYAEPALDPFAPEGVVLINNDAQVTNQLAVQLTIQGPIMRDLGVPEVILMQVSNTPGFETAVWQPYQMNLGWVLDPDPLTGAAFVYVRFLDRAGNVNAFAQGDGIIYEPIILVPQNGLLDLVWAQFDFGPVPLDQFTLNFTKISAPDLGLTVAAAGSFSGENSQVGYRLQPGNDVQLYYGGRNFLIEATDENGDPVMELPEAYEMTIHYEDWQWQSGGILSESSLNLYRLTESGWVPLLPCAGCVHDVVNNVLVVRGTAVGEFALLGERATQLFLPLVIK
ncbi:MAG: VWA domain-containing protein [Ardenticatenaceae bacterium]|nr:VWA domain-containing protein [Ardenticatenaceae bacterium]